jgi:hypothetical protein
MKKKSKDFIKNTIIALLIAIAPVVVQEVISDTKAAPAVNVTCSK